MLGAEMQSGSAAAEDQNASNVELGGRQFSCWFR
jgi:hypothetical protein